AKAHQLDNDNGENQLKNRDQFIFSHNNTSYKALVLIIFIHNPACETKKQPRLCVSIGAQMC
ncbi:hypothetical protein, partial [Eubacterium sp.]|uniref:hypothetical protein n=1 Tax=Eubacterium sp. TaxID=142586 RepID=UPI0026DEE8E3